MKPAMQLQIDPRLRTVVIPPIVLKSNLDTNERMCVGVLAMHGEVSFPRRERIAALMGCSLSTAKRTLMRLEAKIWLVIERRKGDDGRQTSNRYLLRVPESVSTTDRLTAVQDEPRTAVQPESLPGSTWTPKKNQNLKSEEEEKRRMATKSPASVGDGKVEPTDTTKESRAMPPVLDPGDPRYNVGCLVRDWVDTFTGVYKRKPSQAGGKIAGLLSGVVRNHGMVRTHSMVTEYFDRIEKQIQTHRPQWNGRVDDFKDRLDAFYEACKKGGAPGWDN